MNPYEKEHLLRGPDPDIEPLDADERVANFKIRRHNAIEAELHRLNQLFTDEIQTLTERQEEMTADLSAELQACETWLDKWHRSRKSAGDDRKRVVLPAGVSSLSTTPVTIEVEDDKKEELRAVLEGIETDDDGGTLADEVWVTPPPVTPDEKFYKSKVNALVDVPPPDKRPEAGSREPAKTDDGVELPGVFVVTNPDSWGLKS